MGLHGLQNLQESARPVFVSLQISHHTSAEIALQINGLRVVQGGLKSQLDALVASGETGFLMLHGIALSNASGIDLLKSTLWETCSYIAQLQAMGSLKVITASELAREYSN
jgi:hypothetical protein